MGWNEVGWGGEGRGRSQQRQGVRFVSMVRAGTYHVVKTAKRFQSVHGVNAFAVRPVTSPFVSTAGSVFVVMFATMRRALRLLDDDRRTGSHWNCLAHPGLGRLDVGLLGIRRGVLVEGPLAGIVVAPDKRDSLYTGGVLLGVTTWVPRPVGIWRAPGLI